MGRLQRWFITGLILLAPAYVTGIVLIWIFRHLDAPIRTFISNTVGVSIPGIGVAATLLLVLAAGAVASTILVRNFVRGFEWVLHKVPLVRTIYSAIKQLLSPFEGEGQQFSRVVMVEAPDQGLWSLGFLVKKGAAIGPDGRALNAVLLPSNHLHLGNVILVPDGRMLAVDMSIEEGLKFLVSMGAALERPLQLAPALPASAASGSTGRADP